MTLIAWSRRRQACWHRDIFVLPSASRPKKRSIDLDLRPSSRAPSQGTGGSGVGGELFGARQGGCKQSIDSKRANQTRGRNEQVVQAEYIYAPSLTKPRWRASCGVHCVRTVAFKPLQRPIATQLFPVRTPRNDGRGSGLKAALRTRRASAPILTAPERGLTYRLKSGEESIP